MVIHLLSRGFIDPIIIESVYALLTAILCLAIYLKLKESYELTKYEGLNYFRYAFLFFGLSYVARLLLSFFLFSGSPPGAGGPPPLMPALVIMLLGYLSTIAILYLIYSSVWERLNGMAGPILLHALAIVLAVISFLSRSYFTLVYMQSGLLVLALVFSLTAKKRHKRLSQLQVLYLLICVLWLFNLFVVDQKRVPMEIDMAARVISLALFAAIFHRISQIVK